MGIFTIIANQVDSVEVYTLSEPQKGIVVLKECNLYGLNGRTGIDCLDKYVVEVSLGVLRGKTLLIPYNGKTAFLEDRGETIEIPRGEAIRILIEITHNYNIEEAKNILKNVLGG